MPALFLERAHLKRWTVTERFHCWRAAVEAAGID
jgi:hypothetical protein